MTLWNRKKYSHVVLLQFMWCSREPEPTGMFCLRSGAAVWDPLSLNAAAPTETLILSQRWANDFYESTVSWLWKRWLLIKKNTFRYFILAKIVETQCIVVYVHQSGEPRCPLVFQRDFWEFFQGTGFWNCKIDSEQHYKMVNSLYARLYSRLCSEGN